MTPKEISLMLKYHRINLSPKTIEKLLERMTAEQRSFLKRLQHLTDKIVQEYVTFMLISGTK